MSRGRSDLTSPPDDLSLFPARSLTLTRRLWRIHWADKGAWWFCSNLEHRFDLPHPLGTCHLAEHPLGSFLEVFTDVRRIAQEEIDARRLSELLVPRRMRLADCTSPHARGFGCTGEIHTTVDYELTRGWATAFVEARFDGIRYFVRHDPSFRLVGIALFGRAGEPQDLPDSDTGEIPPVVISEAARRFGILVLPVP